MLLSCLTNDEAVRSVYTGAEGVFAGARAGTVVLEMSTISPESSRELHKLGATLRLMNKDFKLILKAAAEARIPMPATEAAFRVNSEELAGGEEEDFSAVLRRMEEVAGIAADRSAPVGS